MINNYCVNLYDKLILLISKNSLTAFKLIKSNKKNFTTTWVIKQLIKEVIKLLNLIKLLLNYKNDNKDQYNLFCIYTKETKEYIFTFSNIFNTKYLLILMILQKLLEIQNSMHNESYMSYIIIDTCLIK